jgi:hypothetical protein
LVGVGVGIGAPWGRRRVVIGGQRTFNGVRIGGRRASGCESAVSGRSTGCETIVVARRAAGCFETLVGGLADIACAVEVNTWQRGAILDSPYPDTILDGTTMSHRAS